MPSWGHGEGLCALVGPWGGACAPSCGGLVGVYLVVRTGVMGRGLCALVWWTGGCVPGSEDWGHGEGPVCPRVVDWWVCTW